jgi:toxin ParE1/3/4
LAWRDLETAVDHYRQEAGARVAAAFADAVEAAVARISRHPRIGFQRFADALGIPGLRAWPIRRFPYLLFYVERASDLDLLRVLQAERDIPAWLRQASD